MPARRLVAVVFLLVGAGAGWMTWVTARAGDDGKWMFGVFALFFLVLSGAALFPEVRPIPKKETSSGGTRFVSHWFLLSALLLTAAAVLISLVVHLLAG